MSKWLSIVFLFWVIFTPASVKAQTPVTIDSLEIDIWPEYDQPSILVIYRITLASGTPANTELALTVPAQVNDITIARLGSDGVLYEITDSTKEQKADGMVIHFTAPVPQIQFEYYIPSIKRIGSQHSFSFLWSGDYAVKSMRVQVQQPLGASAMQITPSFGSGMKGADNLTYYNAMFGSVDEGKPVTVDVQYQKANNDLTNPKSQLRSSEPITTETPGRAPQLRQVLSYTLGVIGILVILGSLIYYWRSNRKSPSSPYKRHARSVVISSGDPVGTGENGYCHECGKRAAASDRFCRACGTPLRREA